jgi:hypothetical protein
MMKIAIANCRFAIEIPEGIGDLRLPIANLQLKNRKTGIWDFRLPICDCEY